MRSARVGLAPVPPPEASGAAVPAGAARGSSGVGAADEAGAVPGVPGVDEAPAGSGAAVVESGMSAAACVVPAEGRDGEAAVGPAPLAAGSIRRWTVVSCAPDAASGVDGGWANGSGSAGAGVPGRVVGVVVAMSVAMGTATAASSPSGRNSCVSVDGDARASARAEAAVAAACPGWDVALAVAASDVACTFGARGRTSAAAAGAEPGEVGPGAAGPGVPARGAALPAASGPERGVSLAAVSGLASAPVVPDSLAAFPGVVACARPVVAGVVRSAARGTAGSMRLATAVGRDWAAGTTAACGLEPARVAGAVTAEAAGVYQPGESPTESESRNGLDSPALSEVGSR